MHAQSHAAALGHQHCHVLFKQNPCVASFESDSDHCLSWRGELHISVPNDYPVQEIRPQTPPLGFQFCDLSLSDRPRCMPYRISSMGRKVWLQKCDLLESIYRILDALHYVL